MLKKKWPLFLVLTFLVGSEFILPVKGRAQSFVDTGAFYFTGTHYPLRTPLFREFLTLPNSKPGDELKVGPVRLHPFLGVGEVWTDNVFRRNTDRRSDFLTTIAPGLQALLPFSGGKHSVLLDYRAAQFLYKKFSQNNVLAQEADVHVSLNFPNGLQFDLQGGHIDGYDPRGSEVDTQQTDITKWDVNSIMSQAQYSGPNGGIRLRSLFIDLHYKNNGQAPIRDRTNNRADLTVFANLTPSTSALLGVLINDYTYDKNKQLDGFSYGVFTGFSLAQSRQISGEFNIGYTVLNYDHAPVDSPPGPGLSTGSKQTKSLYMQGNLNWNPTSRTNINIRPFRSISQSVVFNTANFIRTGVYLTARHAITDRIALRGQFYFEADDFNTGRLDKRFRWRMGPEYRTVKWLGFRLDYIFENRDSNQSNFNYYSNSVMFTIQAFL